eukprot:TRINITY_DN23921_c0_g1_i1.p2 TRINITY_DN23921_c0_g1~~TRINITY_DN23921_c0_g1_i1.p2  ORF type:complete len:205 (-),score=57.16 TRINITY_DN23921_c0_g1_i1:119-733(-)
MSPALACCGSPPGLLKVPAKHACSCSCQDSPYGMLSRRRSTFAAYLAAALSWSLAGSARARPQRSRAVPEVKVLLKEEPPESLSASRKRIWHARKTLQAIDEAFLQLLEENRGFAVRRELQKVADDLGDLPKLARDLVDEPGKRNDFDDIVPLVDKLGYQLRLASTWTAEGDDCWNYSCNVQELDEARSCYLEAVDTLLELEQF